MSIIFRLLLAKRPFKAIFSFNSIRQRSFSSVKVPASYPGEGLLSKKTRNFSRYSNYHYIISWRTSQHRHAIMGVMNPKYRRPLAFYPTKPICTARTTHQLPKQPIPILSPGYMLQENPKSAFDL